MNVIDEINRWWPVLSIIATLACGWCLYQLSRRFVSKDEHEALHGTVRGLGGRVDVLERRMETVPDAETSISGMKGQINILVQHHLENSKV